MSKHPTLAQSKASYHPSAVIAKGLNNKLNFEEESVIICKRALWNRGTKDKAEDLLNECSDDFVCTDRRKVAKNEKACVVNILTRAFTNDNP